MSIIINYSPQSLIVELWKYGNSKFWIVYVSHDSETLHYEAISSAVFQKLKAQGLSVSNTDEYGPAGQTI